MSQNHLDGLMAIDLDAERGRRAAEREATGATAPIRIGGETIAVLPAELPLDVLTPLRRLDSEITLILRSVMTLMNQSAEARERWDATSLLVDVLAANPALPTTVLDVIEDMATRLLGEQGLNSLIAARLTREDVSFLAKNVFKFYGVTLGESGPASLSSTEEEESGGETSKPTSSTTTESTSDGSGSEPETQTSSESGGS